MNTRTAQTPAVTRTIAVNWAACAAAALSCAALSGCAGFSKDGGFDAVAAQTRTHLDQEVRWNRTEEEAAKSDRQVAEMLQLPLSARDAVQIALLNNRSLQASFEDLGISEADLVQAGRVANPRFTLRHAAIGAQYDIEETLTFNVLSLLTEPYAREIEMRRFAQVQGSVVVTVVQLANDTRQAYFSAVAAAESVHYLEQVKTAAEAGAELARRMRAAGNWNALDQAREQGFYDDAQRRMTQARWQQEAAAEKLRQLMGLSATQSELRLAQTLPELPQNIEALPEVEGILLQNRIDLKVKRLRIDALAHNLGLTKATRFINVLDAGPTRVLQGDKSQPYQRGYEVSLEVPIFDSGGARVRRAEALYSQAVDRFAQSAVDARSEIRRAYAAYRARFDIAKQQRDAVLPNAKLIAAQNLLRYNASLISVFDLLADARSQVTSVDDYIRSVRDFWMAKSELDATLLGNTTP